MKLCFRCRGLLWNFLLHSNPPTSGRFISRTAHIGHLTLSSIKRKVLNVYFFFYLKWFIVYVNPVVLWFLSTISGLLIHVENLQYVCNFDILHFRVSILVDPLILINPNRCLHINFTFHSSENIMTSGSIFQNRLIFGTFADENNMSTYFDFTSDKWIKESQNWNAIFRLLMFIILNYVVIIFPILLALIHLCTNLNARRKALWVKVQEPAWSDFETLI